MALKMSLAKGKKKKKKLSVNELKISEEAGYSGSREKLVGWTPSNV